MRKEKRHMQDYHLHSYFSGDSEARIEAIKEQAEKLGIQDLMITDHIDDMDTPFAVEDTIGDRELYIKTLNAFGLPAGLEYSWDFKVEQSVDLSLFDFVILSFHDHFEKINGKINYHQYLANLYELADEVDDFTVLGHLDLPRRYDDDNRKFDSRYYSQIREIYRLIIEKGKGIELNMKAVSMYGEPNPDWDLLKLYKEAGGEIITIGSDAHRASEVGKGIREGLDRLSEIGFDYLYSFNNGEWQFRKVVSSG